MSHSTTFPSSLHRLMEILRQGLQDHKNSLTAPELESWSIMIFEVMSSRWRKYHTVQHLFNISEGATPIQTLAILFHDLIYLQVDHRIHPLLVSVLPEFYFADYSSIILPEFIPSAIDPSLLMVADLFGFKAAQTLTPYSGANEFLSALVAVRVLGRRLELWDIIQIAACIEITIPFRPLGKGGETPGQRLGMRVKEVCEKHKLKKSQSEIDALIALAVDVSHRDLLSFSCPDPREFMTHTWELVLEGNPVFKSPMHSVKRYRVALLKMEKFLSELDVETLFYHEPGMSVGVEETARRTHRSKRNLAVAQEYLQSKLLTVALIEAIANVTGGDAPLVLFMGENSAHHDLSTLQLENFLDQAIEKSSNTDFDPEVLSLLTEGLEESTDFDLRNSSLTSYLYPRLSAEERKTQIRLAKQMFDGILSHFDYLKSFKKEILKSVIEALIQITWTRESQLRGLMDRLTR